MDIYACSVQKSLLQSYVDLFESNGIRITNINLGINSMIKIGHFLRSLREKTYIVITLDGSSFASYLFVNGKYSISSRYRLIYDRGTNLSFMEITQHVSNFCSLPVRSAVVIMLKMCISAAYIKTRKLYTAR